MAADQTISDRAGKKAGRPSKRRSFWRWLLYALLLLLLIICLAGLWMWSHRMSLIENLAVNTLAEEGVEADLSLEEISKTHVVLKDVSLRYEGERFFGAKKITARFAWREALKGRVDRLELVAPTARLTVDADGKITDGWVPPGFGEDQGEGAAAPNFPPQGVTLSDAEMTINSPFGEMAVTGDVDFKDLDNLTADLTLMPFEFVSGGGVQGETHIDVSGKVDLVITDGKMTARGEITAPKITHPVLDAHSLIVSFDGVPDLTEGRRSFEGQLEARFDEIATAQAITQNGTVSFDGRLDEAEIGVNADGAWRADLGMLSLPDPVRVKALAQTLSLSPALSGTPIAQHFAPDVERQLIKLLLRNQVSGAGQIRRDAAGMEISLDGPVTAKSGVTRMTITPAPNKAAYQFDRQAETVQAALDVTMNQPAGLSARQMTFAARSINGLRLDGVTGFQAHITTAQLWENAAVPARLAPLDVAVSYQGQNAALREINLQGAVDYDGPLPGGIVEGLRADGAMTVQLRPDLTSIDFTPAGDGLVRAAKLETPTDWTASNLSAYLAPTQGLYQRRGAAADIKLSLTDLALTADRISTPAQLLITSGNTDLKGRLVTTDGTLAQDWSADFTAAKIASEDLPGPDTRIDLGNGQLTTELRSGQSAKFSLNAPVTQIQSPLIRAKDMNLSLAGTPDNYVIDHTGGQVKLSGNDLPPLPIEGRVLARGGGFEGQAMARLPQADNTPVAIDYRIKDSRGTATVTIEALTFTPGGLQPQSLVPALRGKIARVEGQATAKIDIAFAADQPLQSFGTAKLTNMNFGTAPGPLTGVNAEIDLDSVLPLKTSGRQIMTVKRFDPGLPLEDGIIEYELIPEGVKVYSARWPLGNGFFSLDPFTWLYAAEENRMTLRLEKVELGAFINNLGNGALQATGDLEGAFPIVISGVDVRVEDGLIRVPDGGVIKYAAAEADATAEVNRYAGAAMEALRNFRYQELFAKINGPLDGEVEVGLKFEGKNEKVLGGQPFAFDVTVGGELFNILRNFNSSAHIKSSLGQDRSEAAEAK